MAIKTLKSIITGYGHAGHDLHRPCISKAATAQSSVSGQIAIVERRPLVGNAGIAPVFRTFEDVRGFHPHDTVVHIATPPNEHAPALYEAVECGFRMFIIEKPLGVTRAEADLVLHTVASHGLKVVPNLPWPGTPLTAELSAVVTSRSHGALVRLEMVQHKSRPPRAREIAEGDSAFDVEMPHQITLALQVAGRDAALIGANCKPYLSQSGPVPYMGGASVILQHGNSISDLQSDLDAPMKERRVDLYFEDGWRLRGWYPVDGMDGSQRMLLYDEKGAVQKREKFWSDPMTDMFVQAYRYFLGMGPAPLATLSLAAESVHLACDAKAACGIDPELLANRGINANCDRDRQNAADIQQEAA